MGSFGVKAAFLFAIAVHLTDRAGGFTLTVPLLRPPWAAAAAHRVMQRPLSGVRASASTLEVLVRETLQSETPTPDGWRPVQMGLWPFFGLTPGGSIQLSESVAFGDGLQTLAGKEQYLAAARAWREQLLDECPDAAVSVVRVAQVDPQTVTFR